MIAQYGEHPAKHTAPGNYNLDERVICKPVPVYPQATSVAGIQGVERDRGVPLVGCGDNDRVDILALQHLAVVQVPILFGNPDLGPSLALPACVEVAHRHLLGVVVGRVLVQQPDVRAEALHSQPHVGDTDLVVRSQHAARRDRIDRALGNAGCPDGCRRGGGGVADELAA